MVALVLSGGAPFLPQSLKVALQKDASSQSAAVWWSSYTSYDIGWPRPHDIRKWTMAMGGIMPSYFDAYVTNNPSQYIVAVDSQGPWKAFVGEPPPTGPVYSGSIPTVPAGTSITLDWACQDFTAITFSYNGSCNSYDAFGNCIGYSSSGTGTGYYYYYNSAVGTNFTAGTNLGSAVVHPMQTTTYSMYCPSKGTSQCTSGSPYNCYYANTPPASFTINVSQPPPPPTATIDAGAGNGVNRTVYAGGPYTITATYTPGSGDSLTPNGATAINGSDQVTSVPCANITPYNASCWTQPDATKTYTFTPAAGTYSFYAAEKTNLYTTYNNYKSVTLTVINQCPNGQGAAGSCTSCNSGFVPTGTIPNNSCVLPTAFINDSGSSPTAPSQPFTVNWGSTNQTACTVAATNANGVLVNPWASGISGSQAAAPAIAGTLHWWIDCTGPNSSTAHADMYHTVTVADPSVSSFSPSPTRVRKSTPTNVTFTWSGANLPAGGCSISGTAISGAASPQTANITIATQTIFTLTCGSAQKQTTVTLVPSFQEI